MSRLSNLPTAPLFVICLFAAGCGSGSDPVAPGPPGPDLTGTGPCNLNTGYAGDDMCLSPPDPSEGMQLRYGPKNYDDAAEVEQFILQPGEETTDCFYMNTPNQQNVFFSEFHIRMRPGSHHLIVSQAKSDTADGVRGCEGGGTLNLIGGTQTSVRDYPDENGYAPEDEGLAVEIAANAQASLQAHFVNTTDKPILREAWMNILYKDPATVTAIMEPVAHVTGLGMNVQPGTTETLHGSAAAPVDMRIVNLFGHYHAHTVRFSTWKIDAANQKTLLYESYDYNEPGDLNFNTLTKNPDPDLAAKTPGGVSGILEFKQGDRVEFECEIVNDGAVPLQFANEVYTAEMCILFGSQVSTLGAPWFSAAQ
jgi:hypothetical protein